MMRTSPPTTDGQPVQLGVNPTDLDTVVVSGETTMELGESNAQHLSVNGTDFNGTQIAEFDSVTFSSSDEQVATVNEDGVVTALRNGTVTITAEATYGDTIRTADLQIQVGQIVVEGSWDIASPDGDTTMTVEMVTGGMLQYSATKDGVTNIETSPLGLVTNLGDFSRGLELKEAAPAAETNETYDVLTGKSDEYANHYRERTLTFVKHADNDVEFDVVDPRVPDDAYRRYRVMQQLDRPTKTSNLRIADEASGLHMPDEADVYWMDYSGPSWNYEGEYEVTTTEGLEAGATPSIPFLYIARQRLDAVL